MAYYRNHVKGEARLEKDRGLRSPKKRSRRKAMGLAPKFSKGKKKKGA